MAVDMEKIEREERAKRLRQARDAAGYQGPTGVAAALNMSVDTYKAHEGRNGFGVADGRIYAKLFNVSLAWLYLGIGKPTDGVLPAKAPEELKSVFVRLIDAPPAVQAQVINYAKGALDAIKETAATPVS
jgi:hypothetical protein